MQKLAERLMRHHGTLYDIKLTEPGPTTQGNAYIRITPKRHSMQQITPIAMDAFAYHLDLMSEFHEAHAQGKPETAVQVLTVNSNDFHAKDGLARKKADLYHALKEKLSEMEK